MPNTSLPTNVTDGQTGRIDDINTAWREINRLSRDTESQDFTPHLTNGWSASLARIQRIGDQAMISVTGLTGGTDPTVVVLTPGAPGVSAYFVGIDTPRRSPLFRTAAGGEFYFVVYLNQLRVVMMNGLTSTGPYRADWVFPVSSTWPSFMP